MAEIIFKKYEKAVTKLIEDVKSKLELILDDTLVSKIEDFNKKVDSLNEKIKLEVAFVGQYSAGKSTIISALTKDSSIQIVFHPKSQDNF